MDRGEKRLSREEYDSLNQQLLDNLRASIAGKKKYIIDEEAANSPSEAEEEVRDEQSSTPGG
jgi:hypothetical protein